jgi:dihydrodipicolinate synthase/N-acetylneuraminate lyase
MRLVFWRPACLIASYRQVKMIDHSGSPPMKYAKNDAKAYARETMRGIWAAALNPFDEDLNLNEADLRRNIRHWIETSGIQGLFIAGKQGEFWSMSLDERKRNMTIAAEEFGDKAGTIMAIKYSVPREIYARLTQMIGGKILVSTSSENDWLDNTEELGWQHYLCSSPPYQLQTKTDLRMQEYTELAFAGKFDAARRVRDSLELVRAAIRNSKPGGKPTAHGKYWQELLGQVGGRVSHPKLELSETEKAATSAAFEDCGLQL